MNKLHSVYLLSMLICSTCQLLSTSFKHADPVTNFFRQSSFYKQSQNLSGTCPEQPVPVDLPSDVPDEIKSALSQLDTLASNSVDKNAIPGIVVSVTFKGKTLWTKGYGVKSKDNSTVPPDADTIFRIGSVSKTFPVIMLYQLYTSGKIQSLDDPLSKYAPSFKINNPFSNADITLRQMASQLSGLPREAPCGNQTQGLNICPVTNEQILSSLSFQSLIHPPWTIPSYSNLAYALLGRLLITYYNPHITFEKYVQQNILEPLQLANTGFDINDGVKDHMAVGYDPQGNVAPLSDLGWIAPAGQMFSTINDLNKLSQFFYDAHILSDNQPNPEFDHVLRGDTRREMSHPYYVNPDRQTGFGTPWEIIYKGNYTIRTKGGNVNGYSALFSFVPELHLGVNALFSGSFDEFTFASKAYDIILQPLVSYLTRNQPNIPFPPNPEVYMGDFSAGVGLTAHIFAKSSTLYLSVNGQQTVYLVYGQVNMMQIFYPESLLPCIVNELEAALGEWLYFEAADSSGKSPGFTIPGLYPSLDWRRTD